MRKIVFLLALLGIMSLFIIMYFSSPIKVNSQNQLSSMLSNQKVIVSGKVSQDRELKYSRIITLTNNISLYCDCSKVPNLKGKTISAEGIIDTFQYNKVKVLTLEWKD